MARRTKYDTHVEPRLEEIAAWCRDGYTDEDISKLLGVSHTMFKEYKKTKPSLLTALKRNKAIADIRVEESLYEKATKRTIVKQVPMKLKRTYIEDGYVLTEEYIEVTEIEEEIPPDTTAMIFWLKNRKPEEWRDSRNIEHTGKDGGAIQTETKMNLSNLSDKELEALETIISKSTESGSD